MPIKPDVITCLATGGYVGFLPLAPGTWGSLLGVGVFVALAWLPSLLYGAGLLGLIGLGVWIAGKAERTLGQKDAAPIVIDEIAGMLLTYWMLPVTWTVLLTGFVCFRLFDILKPLPALERLPGGWGIMLDDLCAGLLAHGCVRVMLLVV